MNFTLKSSHKKLSKGEMKKVLGGAVSSNYCSGGEQLYTCEMVDKESGVRTEGVVCANSRKSATMLTHSADNNMSYVECS